MIDRIRFVRKTCNWRLEVTFITEEKWKKVKRWGKVKWQRRWQIFLILALNERGGSIYSRKLTFETLELFSSLKIMENFQSFIIRGNSNVNLFQSLHFLQKYHQKNRHEIFILLIPNVDMLFSILGPGFQSQTLPFYYFWMQINMFFFFSFFLFFFFLFSFSFFILFLSFSVLSSPLFFLWTISSSLFISFALNLTTPNPQIKLGERRKFVLSGSRLFFHFLFPFSFFLFPFSFFLFL